MNVNDVATEFRHTLKSPSDDAERITELMDAPVDFDIPAHAISRGPNPYLDRCMYCNSPRTASQDNDEGLELLDLQLPGSTVISSLASTQSFSSLKLEIWTCASCRKVAGNFQSFLEANFPQASYDLPFLHDKTCVDPLSCARCQEERDALEKETIELQENWVELRSLVKDLYTSEEIVFSQDQGVRLKFLVDKLCSRDPHQLFLRLESQVREIVIEIKTSLLVKLKEDGYNTPELARDFTSSLLSHYDLLTKKAHLLAQYLGGLSEHLRRFKVTWELLNKHLFHTIAHSDPTVSCSGPTILEQLRQGSVLYERSKNDPYCIVRKRLLKFQEEMSVVVVVWRDCQQLIENYCHEEVTNTQKHVSRKTESFISQQRQYLKEHVIKGSLMSEALSVSESMRNLMPGHKSSTERVLCRNCMRERCTCDECTITHMITCGIVNSEKGEMPPLDSSFNFSFDHTRNVMDITPPSMSSTTSSSGSVSPINIEDKISTFYECEQVLNDALLGCDSRQVQSLNGKPSNDDIDDNAGDDEEEEEEDDDVDEDDFPDSQDAGSDEPHSLQLPICDLKDALWEAVEQHHHQQLLQHQQQILGSQQSCVHCKQSKHGQHCPFQPRIDPELSRQLDIELAKSGLLPGGAGDCGAEAVGNLGDAADDRGSSDSGGIVNPSVCATCQCHACLKQSGHVISASLPLQIPVSSPPAELHLYPHIHGLLQQQQQHYMLDVPSPLIPPIKLPVKLDFDDHNGMQEHLSYAYSDWDNTIQPRPGSMAAQHHHQHHQRLSALNSDLPLPPLVTSVPPFTFDLASHLATHTTHTSTTNTTSAFKSLAGKPLTSSILPTLNNVSHMTSEGSSVDPSRPLDFTSHSKIPQSCLSLAKSVPSSSFSPLSFSCPSSTSAPSSSIPGVSMTSVMSKSGGSCHGPPCSRPTPVGGNASSSKWERNQHCRKFSGNKPVAGVQSQHSQHNIGVLPLTGGLQGPSLPTSPAVLKNLNFTPKRNTQTCSHPLTTRSGLAPHPAPSASTTTMSTNGGTDVSLSCSNSLSTMVNNIGVGTSTPCNDPECNAHHHDDNCDSVDDSCSEKSSSTSTSNQKEGKYCDCCYCEFFGHSNTQVAKTSTNYIEMKDRLRKKLKKRQSEIKHKQVTPRNGFIQESSREELDPLEKKGLDGLLNFINGTDKDGQVKVRDKELTAKAAKRARQKQKKLEEKAQQAKSISPADKHRQPEPEKTLRQLLLSQTLNLGSQPCLDPTLNMLKPKSKKAQPVSEKRNSLEELGLKDAGPSLSKQEINRSSLIIESTRPTISLSPKNLEKFATSQRLLASNNNESSQHMIQFLNVLQQQHHQNKNKSANPSSVNHAKSTPTAQAKNNGTVSTASYAKSNSESDKANGLAKQHQNECQHPPQQLQEHRQGQQQKQQPANKAVNGKVPSSQPSGTSNHVVPSVHCEDVDKQDQPEPQHIHLNGKPVKADAAVIASIIPVTSAAAAALVVNSKNSLADSPSTGSGSSASQSPSCGTKHTTEQVKANGKTKKNKKKNKNGTIRGVDEIFMPKSESELDGDVDDFERELEEFKRFCFEPAEPKERRKIAVNVNLKDIFKKKTGLV
uniref:FAM193 C-terminal domain-containing protein n=1 Tax=Arion vulgaris TaxID=1028688 RepID=A0A0B7A9E4_9EUPU